MNLPARGTGSQSSAELVHSSANSPATVSIVEAMRSSAGNPPAAYPIAYSSTSPSRHVPWEASSSSQAPNAPGTHAGSSPVPGTTSRPSSSRSRPMLAAAGATPCPQTTNGSPREALHAITGRSPPGPLRCGSTTWSTNPAATAASNALPPRSSTAMPAPDASQCVEATIPKVPESSGRVVNPMVSGGREDALQGEDPAQDRHRRGVGRIHPVVAQPGRAQRARLRVRGVRGVVADAEVDRQLGEGDRLADRVAVSVGDLVDRVAERARLHLDHGVGLAVVEVEVAAVLQERALDRHRALVVQPAPEDQERRDVVEGEGVVQPERRAGVLVVDDAGDQDVADVGVERRGLAEHVRAAQHVAALGELAQDVVAGQA